MALPKILLAWEMGGNFGHADKLIAITRALGDRAEVYVAAQDPRALRQLAPKLPVHLLAAPYAPARRPADAVGGAASFPDVLRRCGWHAPDSLAALMESWQTIFQLVRPDVVVAQAAPTALLTALEGPWRTALIGYGYDAPPRCTPMAPLQWWKAGEADRAMAAEARVLRDTNCALTALGRQPLEYFCDAMAADRVLLISYPELDHYGERKRWEPGHPPYLGQLFETSAGIQLRWRDRAVHRLFAYLRPASPGYEQMLEIFDAAPGSWDVILASPGINPARAQQLEGAGVRVVDGPVHLDSLLPDCSLGIHHASNGTASALLTSGVPQLGIPTHTEQVMCARAISDSKLGAAAIGKFETHDMRQLIENLLQSTALAESARAAVRRLARDYPTPPAPLVAGQILELAEARS